MHQEVASKRPMFSIIHPSARPAQWAAIYDAWLQESSDHSEFEYILVCDKRWGFKELPQHAGNPNFRAIWNTGRRCYVDAVNIGAQYATGSILIVNADDQFPCANWDFEIATVLADSGKETVEVSTGTPSEHERRMLVMPILTRGRYERLGFVFYPGYESMFADNDFYESAELDDQLADARHLLFPHRHPSSDATVPTDLAYVQQNRPEAYEVGARILTERQAARFYDRKRKTIVVCLPGEKFSSAWVAHLIGVLSWMQAEFIIVPILSYSSNVHITRAALAIDALKNDSADYILWIDDDNLVTIQNVAHLIGVLDHIPEIDVVSGWCYCQSDTYEGPLRASVGMLDEKGNNVSLSGGILKSTNEIIKIDWTGFPVVLMRRAALAKIHMPFAPLMNDESFYGFDSEDIAFSKRAKACGLTMAVDPRVKVPHLKLRDADSIPAQAGTSKGEQ